MTLRIHSAALLQGVLAVALAASQNPSPESGWSRIDRIFEQTGRDLPGGVRRYGWARTDLRVTVRGVPVEPALALGSWAAFQATGNGDETVAMGDLVLVAAEVGPVLAQLQSNGIEVLAIHNHLIDETPRLLYVHFHARGEASELARGLISTLEKSRTPLMAGARPAVKADEAEEKAFETIESILGRKGSRSGRVLQISEPRTGRIEDSGMEVPPGMGMATALNFQMTGSRVAAAGDFVLVADEVNPVLRSLQLHGVSVTALHSHMLREEPRLFFLHFWGVGPPDKIADALKDALGKAAVRP